mgnify:FL=1
MSLLSASLSDDTKTWVENKIRDLLGIKGQITEQDRDAAQQKQLGMNDQQKPGQSKAGQKPVGKKPKGETKDGDKESKTKTPSA